MFGATLLINGGGSAMIGAVIFDPWLLISTFWGTNIENRLLRIINSDSMKSCLDLYDEDHAIFDSISQIIFAVNAINICLWTMCAMSLSAGLLIDIICSTIREFEFCLHENLTEEETIWNKMTCCITKAVEAVDDAVDDALETANIKNESSEDEKEENQHNEHHENYQNLKNGNNDNHDGVELAIINGTEKETYHE